MGLNEYAYYKGYLTPLPPEEKQRYQFMNPIAGKGPKTPDEMIDPAIQYILSQKHLPVRKMPRITEINPTTSYTRPRPGPWPHLSPA
jgi:hypothetical protein